MFMMMMMIIIPNMQDLSKFVAAAVAG